MVGVCFLLFLLSFAEATPGGVTECTNNLNICNTNLTNAQTMYGVCLTTLNNTQTSLATCQDNAQTSLAACQANLATCQANTTACSQPIPPPSWYQKLPCGSTSNCPRFEVLADWNSEAVLDKETGLVWEKSPALIDMLWSGARLYCYDKVLDGRKGWRLPTIEELLSLVDTSMANPSLPSGHPFSGYPNWNFWSSSTHEVTTSSAWKIEMSNGSVFIKDKEGCYISNCPSAWCVRGGYGYNAY